MNIKNEVQQYIKAYKEAYKVNPTNEMLCRKFLIHSETARRYLKQKITLSKLQTDILKFIIKFQQFNERNPTKKEISIGVNKTTSITNGSLSILKRENLIKIEKYVEIIDSK